MIPAAGIMFMEPGGAVLLLKRGPDGDWPGAWCFPGGKQEDGETAEETACREATEELGFLPDGTRAVWTRRISANLDARSPAEPINPVPPLGEPVDYTTFIQRVPTPFDPEVNGEHTGFAWALPSEPPEPLHPGVSIALARLTMDELGVAQAIADGELTSPQPMGGFTLFAIRITGTGTAYRSALSEHVYRPPENYLTPRFLARCNGLPVIWEHPDKSNLDAKEFEDRVIGTIMLPYISGDEVWGIARIYDAAAIALMENGQLSTSPSVVFRKTDGNVKVRLEDDSILLIEGDPSLLDHIAVCANGVWDKGGEPTGVISETNGVPMTEEEMKAAAEREDKARKDAEEKARMDADAGHKLDKILAGLGRMDAMCERMDAIHARMDAIEKSKEEPGEPKEVVADKARKDAEEKEKAEREEKERADKSRRDAEQMVADAVAAAKLPKPMDDADYAEMADAQSRADSVYSQHGARAPGPMQGETTRAYRNRLARGMQKHSKPWADIDLVVLPDAALAIAETAIYSDAAVAARSPVGMPAGRLREIEVLDHGRVVSTFVGNGTFIGQMKRPSRRVTGIRTGREG